MKEKISHQKHPTFEYTKNSIEKNDPTEEAEEESIEKQEFDKENYEKMKPVAKNMIDCFGFNPKKESFLLITDKGVIEKNGALVDALKERLLEITSQDPHTKGNFKIMIAPESYTSALPFGETIGAEMENRPILILTSMSRSHSPETGKAMRGDIPPKENYTTILKNLKKGTYTDTDIDSEKMLSTDTYYKKLKELAQQKKARIISCTKGTNPFEILTKGAVEELPKLIKERGEKVKELMKDVKTAHITTGDGTDITINIRPDKADIETGNISKPGDIGNYPMGEWSCSVFWKDANGTWVVNGPFGGKSKEGRWHNLDWVQEKGSFKLTIKDGEITEINGRPIDEQKQNPDNNLVTSYMDYLDKGNDNNNHGYKMAEFALGTNTKACQDKEAKDWGSTETEKKYGTCHIAVGSNGSFGVTEDDPNYNPAEIHCDMICLDAELNIECIRNDGSKFYIIKDGKPQGY